MSRNYGSKPVGSLNDYCHRWSNFVSRNVVCYSMMDLTLDDIILQISVKISTSPLFIILSAPVMGVGASLFD